jgi:tRNA-dihydrouridine synthase B
MAAEGEKKLKIGGLEVSGPIWLAPLADVTTATFRALHRELGASLTHTEMISAVGLSYKNKKTFRMLGETAEPDPIVLQLFGPDPEAMENGASRALCAKRFDAIEINMACPMPKVTKKCGGASLLSNPDTASVMVKNLKAFGLPVWVKLRITDRMVHPLCTEDFCGLMLESGADLLILHGRTPAQRYEGFADKEAVLSASCKFPGMVAATGDFFAPEDAKIYLDGGCPSVLAARGVMKDTFLIPKTLKYLGYPANENFLDPSANNQLELMIKTGRAAKDRESESYSLVMVRRLLSGMLKGHPGVISLRQVCSACRDWDSLEKVLSGFGDTLAL